MELNKDNVICQRCGERTAVNGSLCSECIKEIDKQIDKEIDEFEQQLEM
jgi:predicted amidophosphoribosyltransferase